MAASPGRISRVMWCLLPFQLLEGGASGPNVGIMCDFPPSSDENELHVLHPLGLPHHVLVASSASVFQCGVHASTLGLPFSLLEQSRVVQDVCRLFMYRARCYSMLQEPFYIAHNFNHILVLNVNRLTELYFNKEDIQYGLDQHDRACVDPSLPRQHGR
jgi:hypothetical protein